MTWDTLTVLRSSDTAESLNEFTDFLSIRPILDFDSFLRTVTGEIPTHFSEVSGEIPTHFLITSQVTTSENSCPRVDLHQATYEKVCVRSTPDRMTQSPYSELGWSERVKVMTGS